jgi:hypothetical protein
MNPIVCIGCGEPIPEKGNALSRNPNLCASCSSMADGMDEQDAPQSAPPERERRLAQEKPVETRKAA